MKIAKLARMSLLGLLGVTAAGLVAPREAQAFCGFYVSPGDQPLVNDATMVALMRDGTRTVISMSNNYKGPASDFAMVVPVPVVLSKETVKTLDKGIFQKLERLSAPRLVEYWEQDPCAPMLEYDKASGGGGGFGKKYKKGAKDDDGAELGVKIEAQFTVGEYEVLILSATQSDGLEKWLIEHKYNIPKGAALALAPYIKEQQKFFVAKVDIKKVAMDSKGAAILSPLRFNYETPDFRLPVRLGLLNAGGKQDLIVYVLAKDKRYEVANYPNAFIPTNLEVADATRESFGPFYATLFDAALAKSGGKAVITEYSWSAGSCDPCPVPPLEDNDVATLGGDVLFKMTTTGANADGDDKGGYYGGTTSNVVLTRLHARYDAATLTDDLVFRAADGVVGGREFVVDPATGALEKGAVKSSENNFQGRYIIRHAWTGKIECDAPRRHIWGGPPGNPDGPPQTKAATDLAATPRGAVQLASLVVSGLDDPKSWDVAAGGKAAPSPSANPSTNSSANSSAKPSANAGPSSSSPPGSLAGPAAPPEKKACGCSVVGARDGLDVAIGFGGVVFGIGIFARRRFRSRKPRT